MKRKIYLFGLLVFALFTMVSCSKTKSYPIPDAVVASFEKKYPNVIAHWGWSGGLYKAEFYFNDRDVKALFKNNGEWVVSETDLYVSDFPAELVEAITFKYPSYRIDDVDLIESPSLEYYVVELEGSTLRDLIVKITKMGEFID